MLLSALVLAASLAEQRALLEANRAALGDALVEDASRVVMLLEQFHISDPSVREVYLRHALSARRSERALAVLGANAGAAVGLDGEVILPASVATAWVAKQQLQIQSCPWIVVETARGPVWGVVHKREDERWIASTQETGWCVSGPEGVIFDGQEIQRLLLEEGQQVSGDCARTVSLQSSGVVVRVRPDQCLERGALEAAVEHYNRSLEQTVGARGGEDADHVDPGVFAP